MVTLALAIALLVQGTPSPLTGVVTGQIIGLDGRPAAGVRVFVMASASDTLTQLRAGTATEVIQCVEDAIENKKPFVASLQQTSRDSNAVLGIARRNKAAS